MRIFAAPIAQVGLLRTRRRTPVDQNNPRLLKSSHSPMPKNIPSVQSPLPTVLLFLAAISSPTFAWAAKVPPYWEYNSPITGVTIQGTWSEVKTYSIQTVNAYYASLGIPAICDWTSPEPVVPVIGDFLGNWGGYRCTGKFRVTWVACSATQVWVDNLQRCVPVVDTSPPNEQEPLNGKMCVGNPIYPITGAKRELVSTDIKIGRMPIQLTYDNTLRLPGIPIGALDVGPQILGGAWSSSIHKLLIVAPDGKTIMVWRGDGSIATFFGDGSGNFTARSDSQNKLIGQNGDYLFINAAEQSIERYASSGKLMSIQWRNGEQVDFTYSGSASIDWPGAGYLIAATDGFGKVTNFRYFPDGRLRSITPPDLKPTSFEYDDSGRLKFVTWADNAKRQYGYGNPAYPLALTDIADELGVPFAKFGYDTEGRAISTEHSLGIDKYSVNYQTPPSLDVTVNYNPQSNLATREHQWKPPAGAAISTPSNATSAFTVKSVQGRSLLASQTQSAGAGCAASTKSQDFDSNGNVIWRNDFRGYRTCFNNDSARNLPIVQVEGLAAATTCSSVVSNAAILPAGARKTTTSWHPDWNLEVQVARPRNLTTYVYNGQRDPSTGTVANCAPAGATLLTGKPLAVLCKRSEVATTDADGRQGVAALADSTVQPRVWEWTYNDRGQVKTVTDPLSNSTQYTYYTDFTSDHSPGDLATVVNARLQPVAEYTKYDSYGLWLEMKDANGVLTTRTFDARRRVKTSTTAGITTTYDYWPNSLLKKITFADSSFVEYKYDDAQRLTSFTDNFGNSVTYTLDSNGVRLNEEVRDLNGSLAKTISRLPDALGRIQQLTGRD